MQGDIIKELTGFALLELYTLLSDCSAEMMDRYSETHNARYCSRAQQIERVLVSLDDFSTSHPEVRWS